MTSRFRHPGGFGADDPTEDITEVLNAIRPAAWDGTTLTFGGASDAGLGPASVYGAPVADEVSGVRQAIEQTGLAERRRAASGPQPRLRAVPPVQEPARPGGCTCTPPSASGAHKPPCPWSMQQQAPAAQHDGAIALELAEGWPHLFEVRCQFPAAASATPIPCGTVHRDEGALTFRDLRRSAFAAGWHLDAFGRFACPRCCQHNPAFRTLYPVAIWAEGAAGARGEMRDFHEVYGGDPVLAPDGQILTVAAEHVLTERAEHDLIRDVREHARRGRHAGGAR